MSQVFRRLRMKNENAAKTLWCYSPCCWYTKVVETDKSEYVWHGVAFLVLDGGIACCVGRLAPIYDKTLDHLDGRLAQVTLLFSDSSCPEKIEYSRSNNGVCLATLVDTTIPGDRALNSLLRSIEGNYGD
ncbi:hypothetical protein IV203_009514 [Nitzschia inconspicua]|uniref:Uncharacterized protein n=1 Tax=Nitzschia inconspicua TaxID=303405 RepID=A0A9K3KVJ1_9STRA|nr:hypothetical protein IV203_009514 [Nitzschia inconspicua]